MTALDPHLARIADQIKAGKLMKSDAMWLYRAIRTGQLVTVAKTPEALRRAHLSERDARIREARRLFYSALPPTLAAKTLARHLEAPDKIFGDHGQAVDRILKLNAGQSLCWRRIYGVLQAT